MSRITRALERAAKTRGGNEENDRSLIMPARAATEALCDPSVFEVREGGVNREAVNPHVVTITDPYSHAAEEYRKLRARVLRATEKDFQNTIMVTSALDGEGKTITGINLAVAIAYELDHTVLLVDADLRKPNVHTYLGLQPSAVSASTCRPRRSCLMSWSRPESASFFSCRRGTHRRTRRSSLPRNGCGT